MTSVVVIRSPVATHRVEQLSEASLREMARFLRVSDPNGLLDVFKRCKGVV